MASKVCNCNALTVPHVHDSTGIHAATDMERKMHEAAASGASASQSRFSTPVTR